jgi:hypothetical protein
MTLIIVLAAILALAIFGLLVNGMNRLYFTEKEVEVIDYVTQYNTEYPKTVTGYHPVVKFEVEGKTYQGELHVMPDWPTKERKTATILYNPKDPKEFVSKETSSSPVTGCIFIIALAIALAVALYNYFQHH